MAVIRGERSDARVPAETAWRPGDLVEAAVPHAAVDGGDYPAPGSEVARLPRARMAALQARAVALSAVRTFFAGEDFLEVETPLLVPAPGLEIHLDAIRAGAAI